MYVYIVHTIFEGIFKVVEKIICFITKIQGCLVLS